MKNIVWKYVKNPVSREAVLAVATQLSVRFPESYITCVMKNNGGRPEPCVFDFFGRKEAVFEVLLRIEPESKQGLLETYKMMSPQLPSGYIPFASDPFGNYLCFRYPATPEPKVVFWDREKKGAESISYICESFEHLLQKLYQP